jgi:hypothetical protein
MTKKVILIIVVLLAGFVWFQIRPIVIRKNCQEKARDAGAEYFNLSFLNTVDAVQKSQMQSDYMDIWYTRCLHDNGIDE